MPGKMVKLSPLRCSAIIAAVRTMNVKGKTKRHGQSFGKRKDWKKAYVVLKEGQDIDFAGSEG